MSVFSCPTCGQQYGFKPDLVGKSVRCQKCNNVFAVTAPAAPVAPTIPPLPMSPAAIYTAPVQPRSSGPKKSDEIDYQIFGDDTQYVEVTLDPGEMVIAEAGAMMFMSAAIKIETVLGDPSEQNQGFFGKMLSAGKRALTGESLFMTTFSNIGSQRETVAFAAPHPGKIVPMHLDQMGHELICQKDAFLCGARGTKVGIAFQKKIGVGFFGGEGFIMQRLQGDGIALIHAGGMLCRKKLGPGETLKVDTGCLVALMPSVQYDIQFVGGIKNTLFGGEGLFLATVTGPGDVWLQSLPFSRFAGRINARGGTGGGKEEGSVLNHVGGLGNMLMGGGD